MALDPRSVARVSARKHDRVSSADRRELRRIRWTFTPASSARASSARAMPASRSLLVTALRPVHGPGCSSSRNRRAVRRRRGEILAEALAEDGAGDVVT